MTSESLYPFSSPLRASPKKNITSLGGGHTAKTKIKDVVRVALLDARVVRRMVEELGDEVGAAPLKARGVREVVGELKREF